MHHHHGRVLAMAHVVELQVLVIQVGTQMSALVESEVTVRMYECMYVCMSMCMYVYVCTQIKSHLKGRCLQ
jgi:hypothetical protein